MSEAHATPLPHPRIAALTPAITDKKRSCQATLLNRDACGVPDEQREGTPTTRMEAHNGCQETPETAR